jgi:hypothetical protein
MLAKGLSVPRRVAVRGLQGLVVAGALLHAGSTLFRASPGASVLFDGWVAPGIGVGAGLLCLARAVLFRQARAAWASLGLGLELYAVGTIYWRWVLPLEQPPSPSLADLLWLSFYPLAYVAVVLLVRRRVHRVQASMWLDGIVGGWGRPRWPPQWPSAPSWTPPAVTSRRSPSPWPTRSRICYCWSW